jgi:hypothetical protein
MLDPGSHATSGVLSNENLTVAGRGRQLATLAAAKKPDEEAKAPVQPDFWLSMPNKGAFAAAIGIYLPRQTD